MEDSALVGLRARDAQGRLIYVNRTFCEMVGRPAEELIGRAPPMPYWPSDSLEEAEQRSRRNLAGLAPREGYEAHWVHADGHRVDVMVFESPLVDAGGRQIGWMGSMIDITQRKQLEERERHQAEAMAHQARLTTLGEVASALAHQLNQPLTVIASYNSGVLRMLERAGFADETVLNALRRQGEQVAEAGRIVQRIRSFLTRRAPQRERCDLAVTLHRAVKLLQRDLRQQPIRIEWELPADLPEVLADAVLIEQVTLNLVRNAIDAAQGEQQAPLQLRIQALAEPAQRHVCVCVDDNGPGLQGRSIETLTAPFYSTKTEGMGMGLAICRSVIEAHRGRLDASASAVLGGACFSFTLPIWNEP
jgi:two-component system sensor histidine kinase DctS